MDERISIIIPTRNRPDLVCRAIGSVLTQTYKEIEVIVVVDGPDAATVRALEMVKDSRLKKIVLSENVGPAGARNAGILESKSQWIAFLDDDDEWLPSKLEKQIGAASRLGAE